MFARTGVVVVAWCLALSLIGGTASAGTTPTDFNGSEPSGWVGVGNKTVAPAFTRTNSFLNGNGLGVIAGETMFGGTFQRSTGVTANLAYMQSPAVTLASGTLPTVSGTLRVESSANGGQMLVGWHDSFYGYIPRNTLALWIDTGMDAPPECAAGGYTVRFELTTTNYATKAAVNVPPGSPANTPDRVLCKSVPYAFTITHLPATNRVVLQMSNQYNMILDLTPDQTAVGATGWTRFGLFGAQTTPPTPITPQVPESDSKVEAYIDDLYVGGTRVGFDAGQSMAQFTANGNGAFQETEAPAIQQPSWDPTCTTPVPGSVTKSQDFGWTNTANVNGGSVTGELGGLITRRDASPVVKDHSPCPAGPAYYAYPVSGLDFRTPLHAEGNLMLHQAHADALVMIGWFKDAGTFDPDVNFPRASVGMMINNASDDGIRAVPFARSTGSERFDGPQHPTINRFTKYHFVLDWVPVGPGGTLTLTMGGGAPKTLPIADIGSPATFDRFGLRTGDTGGSPMWIYLDDLQFTSSP